jgi:hypothetical protein
MRVAFPGRTPFTFWNPAKLEMFVTGGHMQGEAIGGTLK